MDVTRRDLVVASVLAAGLSSLMNGAAAFAGPAEGPDVDDAVEALRKAIFDKDKAWLDRLTADQLSYGHSDGRVQTKAEFIEGVMSRKALVKSLAFPELKVGLAGDAAVARHLYASESETDGKATTTRLGILTVWQKQGGSWELLARQGYKLA